MRSLFALVALTAACATEIETGTSSSELGANQIHMQIVAHQDDDFLFINPDLKNDIDAGHGIVTIYLTAGQANGAAESDGKTNQMCAAEFAYARQEGIKAAYANMAGVPSVWTRELIVPDPGVTWPHTVERFTLSQRPEIQLIFMGLPDGGASTGARCGRDPYTYALYNLFAKPDFVTNTIVPDCGYYGQGNWIAPAGYDVNQQVYCQADVDAVCKDDPALCPFTNGYSQDGFACESFEGCNGNVPWQNYDRAGVLGVLSGLIGMYQPIVIRTLDPQPFELLCPKDRCPNGGYDVSFDNSDHTFAARFVDEALANYHGPNATGRYSLLHYKGYSSANYPANIGSDWYFNKKSIGDVYDPYDPNYHTEQYLGFYASEYERYPGSTSWIQLSNANKLVAIAVEDRQAKMWYEQTPGGAWTGPVNLKNAGAPIAPNITLIKRPDGKLQVFALRLPLSQETGISPAPQDIITAVQGSGTTPAFGAWTSLGSPDSRSFVGVPTAVFDGSGRLFVFAKNSNGRISFKYQANNTWSQWQEIDTTMRDIVDGIVAMKRTDGRIEVFATGRTSVSSVQPGGVLYDFAQNAPAWNTFTTATLTTSISSAPTVAKNADGRLQVFYREDTNCSGCYGRVQTMWQNTSGAWVGTTTLYGDAGVGQVAAITRGGTGQIVLFERTGWNGVSTLTQTNANGAWTNLQWSFLSGLVVEFPAAATDSAGRVVVVVKGSDGKLYIRRETSSTAVGSYGPWTQVGN